MSKYRRRPVTGPPFPSLTLCYHVPSPALRDDMQGQATAVDTAFAECSEEECTVLLDDDKIELQRVTIDVPTGSDITGVTL